MNNKLTDIIFATVLMVFCNDIFANPGWIEQNSPTNETLNSVYFINENLGWAAGRNGTFIKTPDGGANWISHPLPPSIHVKSLFFADSLNGFIAGYKNAASAMILKTSDGGLNWDTVYTSTNYSGLNTIYFLNQNIGWAAGAQSQPLNESMIIILKTTDGGASWTEHQPWTHPGTIHDIYFHDANYGWAAGSIRLAGWTAVWPVLLRSLDGGLTWQSCALPDSEQIEYNAIYFQNHQTGWAGGFKADDLSGNMPGIVHKSLNGGASWDSVGIGQFPAGVIFDLQFSDSVNGFAVGSNSQIMHSGDGGLTWQLQFSGGDNSFYSLSFVDSLTGWVVGDQGRIFKTTSGGIVKLSNDETAQLARNSKLFPNFPNPFNNETVISYRLEKAGPIEMVIYNLLGQKVRTLFSGKMTAGEHAVRWDGRDDAGREVASGVFICRMKAGSFVRSRKMLLLR